MPSSLLLRSQITLPIYLTQVHSTGITVTMHLTTALGLLSAVGAATALSPADWRSQSIYQLLTDRFARTDGSTTATCDTQDGIYCGGSWQGVIDKLDYIQGMGFTAVCE